MLFLASTDELWEQPRPVCWERGRPRPPREKYNGTISRFALIADEDVRVPGNMILLNSELNLFLSHA